MKNLKNILLGALTALALAVPPCFANSITIYGTGAGQGSNGQVDAHYTLVSAPTGAGPAYTTPAYPGWVSPPSGTQWINPYVIIQDAPGGNYDYRTTFDLTGLNPNTAVLMGSWAADNSGEILLNGLEAAGTGIGITGDEGFKHLTAFTVIGNISWLEDGHGFLPGLNTLDFIVNNEESSPTGLLVDITGTASPAPEPGSLLLMGSGIVGLAGVLRRRFLG